MTGKKKGYCSFLLCSNHRTCKFKNKITVAPTTTLGPLLRWNIQNLREVIVLKCISTPAKSPLAPSPTCCFSRSGLSDSVRVWTVARQAPLSMAFPRQEYCSTLPFPSPGDLPHPGMEPESPALAGGFLTTEPLGSSWWKTKSVPYPCPNLWPWRATSRFRTRCPPGQDS